MNDGDERIRNAPTVFIVDDEAFNRDIAARYVRKMGLTPKEFAGGAAVLKALEAGLPDLLLLDIHMPEINGLEVLAKAREMSSKAEFPIIMVTADSNPDSVVGAFELGANDYVTKPVDSRTLRARIDTHLQLAMANRQSREFAEGAERVVADQAIDLQRRNQDLVREVTLRLQIEDELRKAKIRAETDNRAKSEFLALITHELITPLHISLGFADLIVDDKGGALSPERRNEYARHISTSMRQLLSIVKDMLTLAKNDVGRLAVADVENNVKALLERAAAEARPLPEEAGVSVEISCDDGVELLGDKTLLGRAFSSLVSNAVKFSHAGATCRIACEQRADGGLTIAVQDEGIGFDMSRAAEIVKPFRQSSEGLGRSHQGLGVGLPLAKAVFEQHGAAMSIESKPGVGTKVIARFPAHRTVSAARPALRRASGE
jgi:signal transduction histidine kinase